MKETILVTGGTGFIGSHTTVELQQAGYDVVIVDNLSNSREDVLDGIEKITGIRPALEKVDLRDFDATESVFKKYPKISGIIHFAASKAVGESVQKPLLYYHNNIVSLINLLQLMPKYDVKGIIFSSSCTVYGQPDVLPATEETPIKKAESPYGNTKQINEEIIADTIKSGSPIKAILLRYFNPIGAHPTAFIGEMPNGVPQNLIPYLTQTAMGIRKELSVFGDDYDTPDGSAIRDYIDVVDLAKAHVVAVGRMIGADHMERRTTRGVGITGLANVVSGALGIVGPVDYSMSPGIIAATGCASRFPLIPAGIGLVVCAFFPGFIECLNAIPGVVMGAVLLYLMASQLSAGMQMMIREKAVDGFDGGIVVGFSLMVALLLSFAPDEALNSIPALIRPIVGNGFVMGVITVLILEHLIFRAGKKAKKE